MVVGTRVLITVGVLILITNRASATDLAAARLLYEQHCASCHGVSGQPRYSDIPDLRRSGISAMPSFQVVNKLKLGGPKKPPFLGRLTDQQLMDTLVYVRTLK